MVSQTVNSAALKKYQAFVSALNQVRDALADSDAVIKQMSESGGRFAGWKVPDKKEVMAARRRTRALLDGLRKESKEYEKELVSRQWRV